VLARHEDLPAVDRAVPGDHAVAGRPALVHPEVVGPVDRERVGLDEGTRVHQDLQTLPRRELAAIVLLLRGVAATGLERGLLLPPQLVDPILDGDGRVRAGRDVLVRGRHARQSSPPPRSGVPAMSASITTMRPWS